jgi:hypothetical protein
MSVLIDRNTSIICQPFTRRNGARLLTFLISLFASISAASTETWQQSIVEAFDEMCLVPNIPTGMMENGEKLASARNWKLDQEKSGRESFSMMHHPPHPNGRPFFIVRVWDVSYPSTTGVKAAIKIAGPEHPDVRYSSCGFLIPDNVVEEVAIEIQRILGSAVISKVAPTSTVRHEWFFSQDRKTVENCTKRISVSSHSPQKDTVLEFLEVSFPRTWGPIANLNFC